MQTNNLDPRVSEVLKARVEMNAAIAKAASDAISAFESSTGLAVTSVAITTVQHRSFGQPDGCMVTGVTTTIAGL